MNPNTAKKISDGHDRISLGTIERRWNLLKILCQRRSITVNELATILNVSTRTIRRDVEILSLTEPIYTQPGRYDGGIYVDQDYNFLKAYASEEQLAVLQKMYDASNEGIVCYLSELEHSIFQNFMKEYTKPKSKKELCHVG